MTNISEFRASKAHLADHLLSDVIFLCSFVLSRPLYFCYVVFLLSYAWKFLAFLYPLFVTVFIVLVALCIGVVDDELFSGGGVDGCGSRVGYLAVLCDSVVDRWRRGGNCDRNGEFECLQDFGMFEMLFGSSAMEVEGSAVEVLLVESPVAEAPVKQISECSDHGGGKGENLVGNKVELNSTPCSKSENSSAGTKGKRLENFLKILDQFERMASNVEEKKTPVQLKCTKTNKVVEKLKAELPVRNGSEATFVDKVNVKVSSIGDEKQDISSSGSLVRAHSQRIIDGRNHTLKAESADEEDKGENGTATTTDVNSQLSDHYSLGTYGSMRREKEWKRTLACKLFEERHNVGGGEGMDSLWEAYEMDSNKDKAATTKAKPKSSEKKTKSKKKSEVESYYSPEEDQEEEADDGQQLCCLQALKLSTGKMNLGMGRPNLVKITKAIKGIGWLHHVTKHSKKVHNNNGDRY